MRGKRVVDYTGGSLSTTGAGRRSAPASFRVSLHWKSDNRLNQATPCLPATPSAFGLNSWLVGHLQAHLNSKPSRLGRRLSTLKNFQPAMASIVCEKSYSLTPGDADVEPQRQSVDQPCRARGHPSHRALRLCGDNPVLASLGLPAAVLRHGSVHHRRSDAARPGSALSPPSSLATCSSSSASC